MRKIIGLILILCVAVLSQTTLLPNGEKTDLGGGRHQLRMGGAPNFPDSSGELKPFNGELKVITSHPVVKYVIKHGPLFVGFHNKPTGKYLSVVKLKSGESLIKTVVGSPSVEPTVINKNVLQWKYANNSWVREYVTPEAVKEVVFQKAGQVIQFKYALDGLTAKNEGAAFGIYKSDKLVFSIQKPYYCTQGLDFISWVPITWEKIADAWVVTYPAPENDCYIDPTIIFGEGAGQTGGDHKDACIRSTTPTRATVSFPILYLRSGNWWDLLRFSLTGHIPTGAIIDSAILTLHTTTVVVPGNQILSIARLATPWGVTSTNEGVDESPATSGQATFKRSFDFNGAGGDVLWSAGNFSAADYGAVIDTTTLALNDPVGTILTFDITTGVAADVLSDTTNFGYTIYNDDAGLTQLASQDNLTVGHRPYLTVDYTVPSSTIIDSISPLKGKRGDTLSYYTQFLIDSATSTGRFAKINNLTLSPLIKWSNDTVRAVVPIDAPRGTYNNPWLGYVPADTVGLDTSATPYKNYVVGAAQ